MRWGNCYCNCDMEVDFEALFVTFGGQNHNTSDIYIVT